KEQLWDLYKQLPKDLQRATFSEEIGQNIRDICIRNKVTKDGSILNVTKTVGYVFLGLLSPTKLSEVLQREFKAEKDQADRLTAEITAEIFLDLKNTLENLYDIKMENPKIIIKKLPVKKADSYRESIS
ncbi:hypothetical protein KKA24_01170, partial [Patescibacteria group bacterium]|nr:hypothetical protein [Patescibacteria group bacterium]